jgi:hypothetical protein
MDTMTCAFVSRIGQHRHGVQERPQHAQDILPAPVGVHHLAVQDQVRRPFGGLHMRHPLGRQRPAPDLRSEVVDKQSSYDSAERLGIGRETEHELFVAPDRRSGWPAGRNR